MNLPELEWIKIARSFIGLKEVQGTKHNPTIIKMLEEMSGFGKANKAWWKDDETPWCGLFVGYCLGKAGRFVVPEWYRAKAWADATYMNQLAKPAYGCLAVYERKGGGHIGFVVGRDSEYANANILVLGGNQSDAVNIKAFSRNRKVSYWWASYWYQQRKCEKSYPMQERYILPVLSKAQLSTKES